MMASTEKECGKIAADLVRNHGGYLSFSEYDRLMYPIQYWKPMGWGHYATFGRKADADKLCAFSAVKQSLLKQTQIGYELVNV